MEAPPNVRIEGGLQWKTVAVILTGFAALGTVHAMFVVPGILREASKESREITREMLRVHGEHPHNGAVKEKEVELMIAAAVAPLEAKIDSLIIEVRQLREGR